MVYVWWILGDGYSVRVPVGGVGSKTIIREVEFLRLLGVWGDKYP